MSEAVSPSLLSPTMPGLVPTCRLLSAARMQSICTLVPKAAQTVHECTCHSARESAQQHFTNGVRVTHCNILQTCVTNQHRQDILHTPLVSHKSACTAGLYSKETSWQLARCWLMETTRPPLCVHTSCAAGCACACKKCSVCRSWAPLRVLRGACRLYVLVNGPGLWPQASGARSLPYLVHPHAAVKPAHARPWFACSLHAGTFTLGGWDVTLK